MREFTAKEQQVADVLVEAAIEQRTVSFTEISKRTNINVRKVGQYLSPIGQKCQELKLPIITVLAVYKENGNVGTGYEEFEPTFKTNPEVAKKEQEKVWNNTEWDELSSVVVEPDGIWSETFKEGTPINVKRIIPLRNGKLRKLCLKQKGCICAVCGFDPKKVFGEGFERTIEVHHLSPVANGEREVAVDDLIPVCATCHKALHAKSKAEPYTPEELKKILH